MIHKGKEWKFKDFQWVESKSENVLNRLVCAVSDDCGKMYNVFAMSRDSEPADKENGIVYATFVILDDKRQTKSIDSELGVGFFLYEEFAKHVVCDAIEKSFNMENGKCKGK